MRLKDILSPTIKPSVRLPLLTPAYDSDFCQEVVAKGWLTEQQMRHAVDCYHLSKSRSGKCIFWMIDDLGYVLDGHIGSSWASQMLKAREPRLLAHWHTSHCLFGMHLLSTAEATCSLFTIHSPLSIGIVDSERSAVILSELYPQCLWLSWVYPANFTSDKLEPLRGHKVILYPRASQTMDYFMSCLEIADQASRLYHLDITVSTIIEDNATASQKAAQIDLVDLLFN